MSVPPPPHIAPYLKRSSWRGITPPKTGFSAVQIQCDLPELAERIDDDDDRAILYEYGCTDDLETQAALGVSSQHHRIDLIIALLLLLLSTKQKVALGTETGDAILFT
ncbi:hypothetical protein M422DRAFT_259977 [Sphaerobolus stellatus SS14]|uniref:Uncharacterized protein n=1 Tax=Sphaerobolus stellatus (strain SS14) TaxID=990650 RepID=A0A0C9U3X1_SPHS4|nr:hypothetical protein M422DRAFT_259977 [Sphaerobolus stellatus SS14]